MTITDNLKVTVGGSVGLTLSTRESAFLATVEAVCGAGKTYAYCQHVNLDPASRFIVAAKTEILCGEIIKKLPDAVLISTEGLNMRKKKAQGAITTALINAVKTGSQRVIVCCHRALELLSMRLHHDDALRLALFDYQVILDEAPSAKTSYRDEFDLTLIDQTPWLKSTTEINGKLYGTDIQALRNALRAGDSRSSGFIVALINGDRISVTHLTKGHILLKCSARSDIYTLCKLYGDKKVWLFAANAKNTAFVKGGLRNGHFSNVAPCEVVQLDPKRNKHHNTSRVNIGILTDKKASITQHGKHLGQIQALVKRQLDEIGHPFIWTCNSDFEASYDEAFDGMGGEQVPYMAEGVNSFLHHDVAVFLGCVNMRDSEKDDYGTPEDVEDFQHDRTEGACYQFVARTCIRVQNDESQLHRPCWFFVLDEHQASYLKKNFFPDANIMDFEPVHIESKQLGEGQAQKGERTRSLVFAAADAVQSTGKKVTAKAVAAMVPDVAFKTVERLVTAWRKQ